MLPSGNRDTFYIMKRMTERHITNDEVRSFVSNAKCMFSQWNEKRLAFYSDKGVAVRQNNNDNYVFKTVWSKNDFDESTYKVIEVKTNMSSELNYDEHFCPVFCEVIDGDMCYDSLMCLNGSFKISSTSELLKIKDLEHAKTKCANCVYSKL